MDRGASPSARRTPGPCHRWAASGTVAWQERIEDPPDHRPEWTATVARHLRCQYAREPRPATARPGHPTHPLPARAAPPAPGQAPRRQRLRLRPPAPMAQPSRHPPPHRPQRHRVIDTAGTPPLGRRKDGVLAGRMPQTTPPLRTQGGTLPRLRRHSRSPDLPPLTRPCGRAEPVNVRPLPRCSPRHGRAQPPARPRSAPPTPAHRPGQPKQ